MLYYRLIDIFNKVSVGWDSCQSKDRLRANLVERILNIPLRLIHCFTATSKLNKPELKWKHSRVKEVLVIFYLLMEMELEHLLYSNRTFKYHRFFPLINVMVGQPSFS